MSSVSFSSSSVGIECRGSWVDTFTRSSSTLGPNWGQWGDGWAAVVDAAVKSITDVSGVGTSADGWAFERIGSCYDSHWVSANVEILTPSTSNSFSLFARVNTGGPTNGDGPESAGELGSSYVTASISFISDTQARLSLNAWGAWGAYDMPDPFVPGGNLKLSCKGRIITATYDAGGEDAKVEIEMFGSSEEVCFGRYFGMSYSLGVGAYETSSVRIGSFSHGTYPTASCNFCNACRDDEYVSDQISDKISADMSGFSGSCWDVIEAIVGEYEISQSAIPIWWVSGCNWNYYFNYFPWILVLSLAYYSTGTPRWVFSVHIENPGTGYMDCQYQKTTGTNLACNPGGTYTLSTACYDWGSCNCASATTPATVTLTEVYT